MIRAPHSEGSDPQRSDPVEQALESYLEALRQGHKPRLEDLFERYPDRVEEIREVLSAVAMVEDVGSADEHGPRRTAAAVGTVPHRLGEYRIIREVGRGGMGVVYEAIQESLGRRVALKLLPVQATLDARSLERFRREARAVASLHHSNIVPVFATGEESGVHYYAMQFIQGQPLDEVLRGVKRLRDGHSPGESTSSPRLLAVGSSAALTPPRSSTSMLLGSTPSAAESSRHHHYFRNAARLLLQASEALSYAHEQGILHRDIKPSNLLLDDEGRLWVTDFGLAKAEGGENLTVTGEVAGTICYMAPERFKGWSDARSDIYSLGITLYECLTLRPAFRDSDRGRLIRKVTSEEPVPPRRVDERVPRDLETIVLKAIEKEPGRRYHAAADLARDLRAFLEDKPIQARRTSRIERVWRWCRRNPALAATASVALVFLAGALVTLLVAGAARDAEREARYWRAFAEARAKRESAVPGRKLESLAMVKQAAEQLSSLEIAAEDLASRRLALRNEAIASLALDDLQVAKSWRGNPVGTCEVTFDADFRRYARGDTQGDISLRSVELDQEIAALRGGGGQVVRLRFSPDGLSLLAEHDMQGTPRGRVARLWSLQRGEVVLEVKPISSRRTLSADATDFSPDGTRLAIGLDSGAIALHELPSARLRRELPVLEHEKLGPLRFHPDGRRLAVSGANESAGERVVLLRDAETGAVLSRVEHPAAVECIAWHPDGRRLAVGCADWCVRVTDVVSGHVETSEVGHSGERAMAYSHAGDILATMSWDRRTRLRDPRTGKTRTWVFGIPHGRGLLFSRDDALLGYGFVGEEIALWNVSLARHFRSIQGPLDSGANTVWGLDASISPDGAWVATTHFDGVHLWDAYDPRELAHLEVKEARGVFVHPSGDSLITVADPGAHRWPILIPRQPGQPENSGMEVIETVGPPLPLGLSVRHFLGAAALSQDGRTFAICHGEHLHAFDLESRLEWVLKDTHRGCRWMTVSADARWLATSAGMGGAPAEVKVWELETGDCVKTIPLPAMSFLGFSPDGSWLVTSEEREHRFFRVGTWEAARAVARDHHDNPGSIAFSRDGKLLARTPSAALVQLVHVGTGGVVANLEAPLAGQMIGGLCFDPGGAFIVITNSNRLLQIWDLRGIREELRALQLDWDEAPRLPPEPRQRRSPSMQVIPGRFEPGSEEGYYRELPECTRRMAASPGRAGAERR